MSNFLITRAKLKKAMNRKKRLAVDNTPPMVKLLRNGNRNFEANYDAQLKTLHKAIRIGYLVETGIYDVAITPAGLAYLAKYDASKIKA